MATPLWKCEIRFDGTNWVDVSGYALLSKGINIQRGRDSETGDAIPVGTCSFTLENNDGRFTAERSASPYYPYVVEGVACRMSVYVSGAYRARFYGVVQSWATSWVNDETGLHAVTAVTVTDTLGDLPDYTLHQAADEILRAREHLVYHWPLRDTEGPAQPLVGSAKLTDNGGTGWGAGGLLAMDEGTDQHPSMSAASGGLTLISDPLDVAPPYRILLVIMDSPGANCTIMSGLPGGHSIKYTQSTGIYYLSPENAGGASVSSYPCLLELVVTATDTQLWMTDSGGGSTQDSAAGASIGTLRQIKLNPTLSGGAAWGAAHLAVSSSPQDIDGMYLTALRLFGGRVPQGVGVGDVLTQLFAFTGSTLTVSGMGYAEATLPQLDGRDLADVLGGVATGLGGRLVDDLDGTLTWLPFALSDAPVALPPGEIDPSVTWQTDSTGSWTDATVTFTDGTSYTARRSARKKRSFSFEGVHTTPLGDRGMADWLVNSPTPARFPQAPYDLMTLSDAQRLTLCSVMVGTRVSLSGLPAQMPAATALAICEGIEESASDTEWTLTLKLSPDVYSRLFVLDDATRGVLDSTYLLAP